MSVPNILATRYASAAMRSIWTPENKIRAERRLWLTVMEAQADLGVSFGGDDPEQVLADYQAVLDDVDLDSIAEREATIAALTEQMAASGPLYLLRLKS